MVRCGSSILLLVFYNNKKINSTDVRNGYGNLWLYTDSIVLEIATNHGQIHVDVYVCICVHSY